MTAPGEARRWVAALSDSSAEIRDWGRARLLDVPGMAVPALIEALGDPFGRHGTVAALLAHLGAENAILPLRLCLASERSGREREEISQALKYLETRVRHSRRRENGVRLLLEVQPYLGREISADERVQLHRVFELGVELCTTTAPEIPEKPRSYAPPNPLLPETIEGLSKLVGHYEPSIADRALDALRNHEDDPLPAMRGLLSAERPTLTAKLAGFLAERGDLLTVPILLHVWPEIGSGQSRLTILKSLVALARRLADEPTAIPITTLQEFVSFAREDFRPEEAFYLAQAIERLARNAPCPELRTLLPLLKGRWLNPMPPSFENARLAIEEATKEWKDLPMPALSDETSDSLPRPARSVEVELEELPRPTEKTKP